MSSAGFHPASTVVLAAGTNVAALCEPLSVTPDRSAYVAVMHSAVTLAPTIGRLVANELVSGEPVAELGRCRPHDLS
jgi:hypothetical protein